MGYATVKQINEIIQKLIFYTSLRYCDEFDVTFLLRNLAAAITFPKKQSKRGSSDQRFFYGAKGKLFLQHRGNPYRDFSLKVSSTEENRYRDFLFKLKVSSTGENLWIFHSKSKFPVQGKKFFRSNPKSPVQGKSLYCRVFQSARFCRI